MRDTESTQRIMQARLIANELWEMLREDAVHRLGLAEAYPQALDKSWSPEFYRRCQLAERLVAILDIPALTTAESEETGKAIVVERTVQIPGKVVPHTARHSRRRLRV